MATILVTGSNGQVGKELEKASSDYPIFDFVFTDRMELDITNAEAVNTLFAQYSFDYCFNCAAFTAVDKAESEKDLAHAVNVLGSKHLAEACAKYDVLLFQLSTDYVYHNDQNTPFKEADLTAPKSVYASTKLEGEKAAQEAHQDTMVIRTSWVYSTFGHNFVKTMLRLGRSRDQLGIVFDQIGTPTHAGDLANAMLTIAQKHSNGMVDTDQLRGIFHYSNEGVTCWYDFAMQIFEYAEIDCVVSPIESSQYPTPAPRPSFSVLNKSKIKETFGITIPYWRTSLIRCLEELLRVEVNS